MGEEDGVVSYTFPLLHHSFRPEARVAEPTILTPGEYTCECQDYQYLPIYVAV